METEVVTTVTKETETTAKIEAETAATMETEFIATIETETIATIGQMKDRTRRYQTWGIHQRIGLVVSVGEEVVEVMVGGLVGQEVKPHPHDVHGKQVVEPGNTRTKVIVQTS